MKHGTTAKRLAAGLLTAVFCAWGGILPVAAENETHAPGQLYTQEDGNYYYEPLEQGIYSDGGYTLQKVSHPDRGAGEVDSILTPEERGQSYSWSMAEEGDYVYIGTCFNSTYYIYYNNVNATLKTMQTNGTIAADVDIDSVTKEILRAAFGVDKFDETASPMQWKPVIMAVNKHTGEAKILFREADIVKQHPEMFPRGYNVMSGYRMAFKFKDKIYFAGMGNPTATLVEVDPATNEAKIVYYNINTTGQHGYDGVSNGVHGLLVFDDEILMCLATDDLNRDGTPGDIGGIIVGSKDPSQGLSSWRTVATQDDFDNLPAVMKIDGLNGGGIWDIIEYNGALYVTIVTDKTDPETGVTNKQGFALYRGIKQADESFTWTQLAGDKDTAVLPYGFGINYSMSCNMWTYGGYLYFGTYNDPMLDLAAVPASGDFEPLYHDLDHSIYLYRMDADGNFTMIAGNNDNPEFPAGPVGNLGAGLGNHSNQYVWRYGEHNGELYIGTYDTSTLTYMFTQLTDGQVRDMSEEDISGRADELQKAMQQILQAEDDDLLTRFLQNTIFSGTSQRLFQKISGIASDLSEDWNPVPQYEQDLKNYEDLKDQVLGGIALLALDNENDASVSAELLEDMNAVAEEKDTAALTVDEFLAGLDDDETLELYCAAFPEESSAAYSAGDGSEEDHFGFPTVDEMKEMLKQRLTEDVENLFAELDKIFYDEDVHNFVYYFGVNYYAQQCERGFDLLVSNDGVNFDAITRNGFGDAENHGLRTIGSTEQGVYMGTANPFRGTQLWRMFSDKDLPLDTDPDATRYKVHVTVEGKGTAKASQDTAVEGKYVTLTAKAEEGYTFAGWQIVSPEGLTISSEGTFRMPGQDVEIKAVFTANQPQPTDKPDEPKPTQAPQPTAAPTVTPQPTAVPTAAAKASTVSAVQNASIPQTSDDAPLGLLTVLCLASLAGIGVLAVVKKRKG